jgi:hypothetical protein
MNFTRIEVLAAGGDGDNWFGGGQPWPNGADAGAEESPDQLGEALGYGSTWMRRWQAAIFRRTALRQACDLWWLAPRMRERNLEARL